MTKTVYDVIDFGVSYIRDVYDKWDVMKVLDKDDSVFPNTLHWQYGHVLTVFEEALAMGNQEVVDVDKYSKLFGTGTKPSDWGNDEVPSIESILNDIKTYSSYHRFSLIVLSLADGKAFCQGLL